MRCPSAKIKKQNWKIILHREVSIKKITNSLLLNQEAVGTKADEPIWKVLLHEETVVNKRGISFIPSKQKINHFLHEKNQNC